MQPYYQCPEWDLDCPACTQPNLDYLAPEYIVSGHCDTASDMFSVGVLFHAIYNNGRPLFECKSELAVFRKHVADVSSLATS